VTKKAINDLTIIIDSREQKPYKFKNSIVKKLDAGDYSILGFENQIAIERKSKSDAYGTIGNGRDRFIRELIRLESYKYKAIIIEASLSNFLIQPEFSKMNPKSAINSLISWSIKYNIHILFGDNRRLSKALCQRILEKFWKVENEK
jgi:ERCC4-type nuclease